VYYRVMKDAQVTMLDGDPTAPGYWAYRVNTVKGAQGKRSPIFSMAMTDPGVLVDVMECPVSWAAPVDRSRLTATEVVAATKPWVNPGWACAKALLWCWIIAIAITAGLLLF
jgi:hypothetical protein